MVFLNEVEEDPFAVVKIAERKKPPTDKHGARCQQNDKLVATVLNLAREAKTLSEIDLFLCTEGSM